MLTNNRMSDRFSVEILDENKQHLEDTDSIKAAVKFCKIKSYKSLWKYLFIKTQSWRGKKSVRETGVLSMDGKRYHFKLKQ